MIYKRSFSFTDDDLDVLKHLDSKNKGSRSAYIASLIRADMNHKPIDEERIKKIIADELQKKNL
jgi:hypothetical protein